MAIKDFKKYLRGKSLDKLLHRARKNSLSRIVANENDFIVQSKKTRSSKRAASTIR